MGANTTEFFDRELDKFSNKVPHPKMSSKAYELCIKADALRIRNYFGESIKKYLGSIMLLRKNPQAYKGLAMSYKETGRYDKAIECFEKAKDIMPFDKTIYFELGECYLRIAKPNQAVKAFKRAITIDKQHLESQLNLGLAHELLSEEFMAIQIYDKVIEQRPSFIAAYNYKGSLLMRMERFEEAARVFKQLSLINPDFYRAYLGIAIAFDKLGLGSDALRYYKKYLKLKPNTANKEHIKSRIKALQTERRKAASGSFELKY